MASRKSQERPSSRRASSYRSQSSNPYLSGEGEGRAPAPRKATARGSVLVSQNASRTKDERSHRPVRRRRVRWYYFLPLVALVAILLAARFLPQASEEVERGAIFPVRYSEQITDSAARHGVDPYLVCAVIKTESSWNANAVSNAGARGLMQVMEGTSEFLSSAGYVDASYDPDNLSDPTTNIEFGCALLGYLDDRLASEDEVIAAYNAGMGAVQQWSAAIESGNGEADFAEIIDYPETKAYLQKVKDAKAEYERLYPDGIG